MINIKIEDLYKLKQQRGYLDCMTDMKDFVKEKHGIDIYPFLEKLHEKYANRINLKR